MSNKKANKEKVAVVKCNSYGQQEVENAIRMALGMIDYEVKENQTVLIKPNIIGPFELSKAATTHPSVIEAVCKILKERKAKILIAESSYTNTELAFKTSGISDVAKKYNAKLINLDKQKLIKVKGTGVLRTFYMPKILVKADLIINIPKMKTHVLAKFTGAVKNLYGTVTAGRKLALHKKFDTEEKFCEMLVDLYEIVRPGLNIMDAVYGMEGNGPTAGKKKKTGLILASENAPALDMIACEIIGYRENEVLTNVIAKRKKLVDSIDKIEVIGKKKCVFYEKPGSMKSMVGLLMFLEKIMAPEITVDKKKCTKCETCEKHCPTNAMKLAPYPTVEKKKCIRCFCCIEVCPRHALCLKEKMLAHIMGKLSASMLKVKK